MDAENQAVNAVLDKDCLKIDLPQVLEATTIGSIWQDLMSLQEKHQPKSLHIDASETTFCDSAGVALLTELRKKQKDYGHYEISGANQQLEQLFQALENDKNKAPTPPSQVGFLAGIGKRAKQWWANCGDNLCFIGELTYTFLHYFRKPRSFRWREFWQQVEVIGPNALFITALLGFLMGLILSFQSLVSLNRFGASIYVINLVAIAMSRELAALMTAVILAGRTASAFAAEIGTMKINQEIDAINTMGLTATKYLVIPRVLAGIIMTPFLSLYLLFFSFVGCYTVMLSQGYNLEVFTDQLVSAFTATDVLTGIFKAFVFGIIISAIGCIHGMRTRNYATAVGESTTSAVVSSIVMLAFADGVINIIFYML